MRFLLLDDFMLITMLAAFVFHSTNSPLDEHSHFSSLYAQGFLSQNIKDIFALLGALLVVEKIIHMVIASTKQGRIRYYYTQHLLPHLMARTYAKEEVDEINNLLLQLSIGKLSSRNEEIRRTGIKQLGNMKPDEIIFNALVKALSREKSKQLRAEIARTLTHHSMYDP